MNASLRMTIGSGFRMLVTIVVLSLIGLVAGAACVVLPVGTPFVFVAIAAGLLLWLMPDLHRVPVTMARRMFPVFIVSFLCIPVYYAVILPGLPWISARRIALLAFAIPTTLILAGSSSYRAHLVTILKHTPFVYWCIIVFVSFLLISTLLSSQITTSLSTDANIAFAWFLPFIGATILLRNERDVTTILKVLLACVIVDFILGAIEFSFRRPFLIYILPPSIRSQIIAANPLYISLIQGMGVRNGLYRAASTFNVSLSWGEMASMLAPIALHFLAHGRSFGERAGGATGLVAAFGSIVMSGSRGAYVGFIAAMIAYALLWAIRLIRTHPKSLLGSNALVILGMGSGLVVLAVFFVGPVRGYVLGNGGTQMSNEARWLEWALAKPKILHSPIWGYGPGTSGTVIGYYPFGSQSPTVDSYLMTGLVEFGVIGFAALTLALAGAVFTAFRRYLVDFSSLASTGNALGCSLIAFMVYRITLSQQENMSTMCVVLGLILFVQYCAKRDMPPNSRREARHPAAPTERQ